MSDTIRRQVPYFQISNEVIDDNKFESIYEYGVYTVLCRYSNNGQDAFPSHSTIAKSLHTSVKSVRRALKGLEEKGYITKQVRFKDGAQTSNAYTVHDQPKGGGQRDHGGWSGRPTEEEQYKKNTQSSIVEEPPIVDSSPPEMITTRKRDKAFELLIASANEMKPKKIIPEVIYTTSSALPF